MKIESSSQGDLWRPTDLVPDDFLNRIISKRPTPTRIASRATQLTTSRDALAIPKVLYSTDDLNVGVAA